MSYCDIARLVEMTQSLFSSIENLKSEQMVNMERRESQFYSLADDHVKTILNKAKPYRGINHEKDI
jgi:hypothetical protein